MQIENILSAFSKVPFIELYFLGYSSLQPFFFYLKFYKGYVSEVLRLQVNERVRYTFCIKTA